MELINFENLPSTNTPINAQNLNQMQKNIEKAIEDIYPTNEIRIGTWKDGKPLYRKVIEISVTNKDNLASLSYDISDLNIDKLVKLNYSIFKGNSIDEYGNFYGTESDFQRIFFRANKLELRAATGAVVSESVPAVVTIIIEYTKTTD